MSCQSRDAGGHATDTDTMSGGYNWIFEYKIGSSGNKIYSHTLCVPCHKSVPLPGVDVMIANFCDFRQYSAKNSAFFLKPMYNPNFTKNSCSLN
jgi:hypothetical protein